MVRPCPRSNIDGLIQKRRNPSALATELRLFCIKAYINFFAHRDPHDEGKIVNFAEIVYIYYVK